MSATTVQTKTIVIDYDAHPDMMGAQQTIFENATAEQIPLVIKPEDVVGWTITGMELVNRQFQIHLKKNDCQPSSILSLSPHERRDASQQQCGCDHHQYPSPVGAPP